MLRYNTVNGDDYNKTQKLVLLPSSKGRSLYATTQLSANTVIICIPSQKITNYDDLIKHHYLHLLADLVEDKKAEFAYFLAWIYQGNSRQPDQESAIRQYLRTLPQYSNNLICWPLKLLQNLCSSKVSHPNQYCQPQNCLYQYTLRVKNDLYNKYLRIAKHLNQNPYSKYIQETKQCSLQKNQSTLNSTIEQLVYDKGELEQYMQNNKVTIEANYSMIYNVIMDLNNQPIVFPEEQSTFPSLAFGLPFPYVLHYYAMIQSRNVYSRAAQSDPMSKLGALIPIVDLINHSAEPNAKYQAQQNYILVLAKRDISRGQQITLRYEDLDDTKFMKIYGAILEDKNNQKGGEKSEKNGQRQKWLQPLSVQRILAERMKMLQYYLGTRNNNDSNYC